MQPVLRLDSFCFTSSFTKGDKLWKLRLFQDLLLHLSKIADQRVCSTVVLVDTDRKRWSEVIMLQCKDWMQTQRQGMINNWHVTVRSAWTEKKHQIVHMSPRSRNTQTSLPCARLGGLLESRHPKRWAWHRLWQSLAPHGSGSWMQLDHSNRSIGHASQKYRYNQVYSSDKKGDRISQKNASRGKDSDPGTAGTSTN